MAVPGSGPGPSRASWAASRAGRWPALAAASGSTRPAAGPFTASTVARFPCAVLAWASTAGVLACTPAAPVIIAVWPMASGRPAGSVTAVSAPTLKAA